MVKIRIIVLRYGAKHVVFAPLLIINITWVPLLLLQVTLNNLLAILHSCFTFKTIPLFDPLAGISIITKS